MLLVEREHLWFVIIGLAIALFKFLSDGEFFRSRIVPYMSPSCMLLLGFMVMVLVGTINSQIKDQGIIEFGSGGNPKEVARLIEILNAGKLPATLNPDPLQEENIGPTLGEDTIAKGITAIVISMLVVPIFMIVYMNGLAYVVCLIVYQVGIRL